MPKRETCRDETKPTMAYFVAPSHGEANLGTFDRSSVARMGGSSDCMLAGFFSGDVDLIGSEGILRMRDSKYGKEKKMCFDSR